MYMYNYICVWGRKLPLEGSHTLRSPAGQTKQLAPEGFETEFMNIREIHNVVSNHQHMWGQGGESEFRACRFPGRPEIWSIYLAIPN